MSSKTTGQEQVTEQVTENREGGSGGPDHAMDRLKDCNEDLNVALVVAGLFSAVTSAFIIYIHPQLQVDRGEESADLLRVILYKTDNTTFGGEVPEVPRWTGPPGTIFTTLILLYLSLVTSMCSVFVTTLTKQLLNLRALAGPSGSDAENGENQQRRLSDLVFATLPVVSFSIYTLLQVSCFCLGCALTIYTWEINLRIAVPFLFLTICVGPPCIIFYVFMLVKIVPLSLSILRGLGRLEA